MHMPPLLPLTLEPGPVPELRRHGDVRRQALAAAHHRLPAGLTGLEAQVELEHYQAQALSLHRAGEWPEQHVRPVWPYGLVTRQTQ